jgi:hypothetical protein
MLVNGLTYSWADIVCTIANVPLNGISAIKYNDKQEKVDNRGAGSKPVNRGYGAYEATASITLHIDEILALQKSSSTGSLLDIPPFTITVMFAKPNGTGVVVDKILNCEFKSNGRDMKTGDTLIETELELIVSEIVWSK